jgi:diacylglycerol kinase (ATP)
LLEHALDGLHPQQAPFVRIAKDCAAAAVLVLSAASVVVFALMLWALL